ncbi:hypothetical protein ES705_35388 [subsurface metagenome]
MGKKENSKGNACLLHKRNPSKRHRLSPKGVALLKDSIAGVMTEMIAGHGTDFVPISIHDIWLSLRRYYDMFPTYRQVGNYMRKLVEEGRFEKEDHHVDKTAKHWSDQYSRYRFTQQPPLDLDNPYDSTAGLDPGRPNQGSDSDTPLE